jgi:hypothetical protein
VDVRLFPFFSPPFLSSTDASVQHHRCPVLGGSGSCRYCDSVNGWNVFVAILLLFLLTTNDFPTVPVFLPSLMISLPSLLPLPLSNSRLRLFHRHHRLTTETTRRRLARSHVRQQRYRLNQEREGEGD